MRWLFEDKRALHGAAAARILSGCSVLGLLISNIRTRDVTFGAGSVWAKPLQDGAGDAPHLTECASAVGKFLQHQKRKGVIEAHVIEGQDLDRPLLEPRIGELGLSAGLGEKCGRRIDPGDLRTRIRRFDRDDGAHA